MKLAISLNSKALNRNLKHFFKIRNSISIGFSSLFTFPLSYSWAQRYDTVLCDNLKNTDIKFQLEAFTVYTQFGVVNCYVLFCPAYVWIFWFALSWMKVLYLTVVVRVRSNYRHLLSVWSNFFECTAEIRLSWNDDFYNLPFVAYSSHAISRF